MKHTDDLYRNPDNQTIKRIAKTMACFKSIKNLRLEDRYDFSTICSYSCFGSNLIRSTAHGISTGHHFLVANEQYQVYEMPARDNDKSRPESGRFLVLFRNVKEGYWLLASLNYDCKVRKRSQSDSHNYCFEFFENAKYECLAQAVITVSGQQTNAICTMDKSDLDFVIPPNLATVVYDYCGIRKNQGYHETEEALKNRLNIHTI